jgi:hypothetical protein
MNDETIADVSKEHIVDLWHREVDRSHQLADEVDELRARVERLQGALLSVVAVAEQRGKLLSHYPPLLSEDAQAEMGLQPGDLPAEVTP